jgi:hypothetical protein
MIIIMVIIMIIIMVVVVIMVMTGGVVVAPVGLILGDAGGAERDLSFGSVPIANALDLSGIPLVSGVATIGDSNDGTAGRPAAIGDIVMVQFGCDSNAGKQEATKREELLSTHDC